MTDRYWVLGEVALNEMLNRAKDGDDATVLIAELYANSEVEKVPRAESDERLRILRDEEERDRDERTAAALEAELAQARETIDDLEARCFSWIDYDKGVTMADHHALAAELRQVREERDAAVDLLEQVWDIDNGASIYLGHGTRLAKDIDAWHQARAALTEETK